MGCWLGCKQRLLVLLADACCALLQREAQHSAQLCDCCCHLKPKIAALGFGAVHVIRNMEDTRFKQVGSESTSCFW